MKPLARFASLLGLIVLAAGEAGAVVFCVESEAQLVTALQTSAANGVSDRIILGATSFSAPAAGFSYSAQGIEEHITIEGGFGPQCSARPPGSKTLLEGANVTGDWIIGVAADQAQVSITNVVLRNFKQVLGNGAALSILGDDLEVLVDGNAFFQNSGFDHAALKVVGARGLVTISNNVIAGNNTEAFIARVGGASFVNKDACLVVNNTFSANTSGNDFPNASFFLKSCTESFIANNILWGNQGADLHLSDGNFTLANNDIEESIVTGSVSRHDTGNINVDPQFSAGILNFRPTVDSPMVDAGIDATLELDNPLDFQGNPRKADGAIDMGAFEIRRGIHRDGFEAPQL